MKHVSCLFFVIMMVVTQACSQTSFAPRRYRFPISSEQTRVQTMKEKAEKQAEQRERFFKNPFGQSNQLVIDLNMISNGRWCFPLKRAKVISPFGARDGRSHTGVDLKTKAKDEVRAAFSGVVTMSQVYSGYGNCIIVRHENGMETLYSHNSKNLVKEGDFVSAGKVIALTGRTGRATTEHLHFEVRVAGRPYNPNLFFDLGTEELLRNKLIFTKNGEVSIR